MHVLHAKDGFRCLLDVESKEVELLHNDKCLVGGSVYLPEVLDVIHEHNLMEKLAIHACMFEGWLQAYARWQTVKFCDENGLGILPSNILAFPAGNGKRVEVSARLNEDDTIYFDLVSVDEENRWSVKQVFYCSLSHLRKVVSFFS